MWHKVNFSAMFNWFEFRFSFFKTTCHGKVKARLLPYYLSIAGAKIVSFIPFPILSTLREKCKQLCPGFELGQLCLFSKAISITPQESKVWNGKRNTTRTLKKGEKRKYDKNNENWRRRRRRRRRKNKEEKGRREIGGEEKCVEIESEINKPLDGRGRRLTNLGKIR